MEIVDVNDYPIEHEYFQNSGEPKNQNELNKRLKYFYEEESALMRVKCSFQELFQGIGLDHDETMTPEERLVEVKKGCEELKEVGYFKSYKIDDGFVWVAIDTRIGQLFE